MTPYALSYWERESFFKNIDVAVVGSGIVGLAAAVSLKTKDPALRVMVLERGPLPVGASTRNAGFACFGSMTELLDDLTRMSETQVLEVVAMRWKGLQRLRAMVGDEAMDYRGNGGYEMFRAEEKDEFEQCADRISEFNQKIGEIVGEKEVYRVVDQRTGEFGFQGIKHLILNAAEGQVHTGKMMSALLAKARACGVEIVNGVGIHSLNDTGAGVDIATDLGWHISAKKALVAVNGFARHLFPELDLYPARNHVLITRPVPGLRVEGCFHYDRGYFYFRNIDGRILLGGGRNLAFEAEKTDQFDPQNELIRNALQQLLREVILPGQAVEIDSWWTGIMGLGPVKRPIIESVSPNVAVSVRLSGMGVAIGTLVGEKGAELVLS